MLRIPLLLFAKSPVPGKVKTRLAQVCGYDQAAEIAKVLLKLSVEKAVRYWPSEVVLVVQGAQVCDFSQQLADKNAIELREQVDGDLGTKMSAAMEVAGFPVAVMGCDVPHIEGAILDYAYQSLSQRQSLIGPAEDGGYYLLGLSRPCPNMFKNKEWGTSSVFSATLEDAKQQDMELQRLATLIDIDEWPDLLQASLSVPELAALLAKIPHQE